MDDKLVTIATFGDAIEATFARQLLGNSGIKSVMTGDNAANAYSGLSAVAPVESQVFETHAEKAKEVLQSLEQQED